jgi:fibronectin-binding autotransporter adhesin
MKPRPYFQLRHSLPLATALALAFNHSVLAESAYWILNGTGAWTTAGNWAVNADGTGTITTVPGTGDTATFNYSEFNNNVTATLGAGIFLSGIVVNNTGTTSIATDTLGDKTITLGAGGITVNSGAGAVSIGANTTNNKVYFNLSAPQSWINNGSGTLSIPGATGAGSLILNAHLLTVGGSGNITHPGYTGGTGGIRKTGAGTLTITENGSSYSGATTIDGGILTAVSLSNINVNSAIGRGSAGGSPADLVFGGGTLRHNAANVASTNRLFTIGNANGLTATIDSSAASATNTTSFTGTGALAYGGSGARTLTLTGSNTGANSFAPVIGDGTGGATSLVKDGAGTWSLSGTNIFTGNTTISGGTLQLGAGGTSGRLTATTAITNNAKLTINRSDAFSQATDLGAGVIITGTGSFTQAGNGTTTLTANNTYSGGTTVSGGTLLLSGAVNMPATGTLAVNAGGIFSLADGTARNTTTPALTLASGAALIFDWNGASRDSLTSTAAVATTAGTDIKIAINASGSPSGSGTLITGGAGSTLNNANYFLANNHNYTATITKAATTVSIGGYAVVSPASTLYWKGGLTDAAGVMSYSTGAASNWTSDSGGATGVGYVPGSATNVIFSATGATEQANVTLGADMSINSLTIEDSNAVTIGGSRILTLLSTSGTAGSTAITIPSGANATHTINAGVNLGANQTWNIASDKTLTVGGAIIGSGSLTKADAGTLTLSGANTGTGGVTLSDGYLTISSASALGTGTFTINGGGTTTLAVNPTISGIVINNTGTTNIFTDGVASRIINLGAGGIMINAGAGSVQFAETNATNKKVQFVLTANQSWINNGDGTLTLASDAAPNINLGAYRLTFGGSGNISTPGRFAGTGGFTKTGSGTLTSTGGASSFTGALILEGGAWDAAVLANVNANSDIGKGSATTNPADLVFAGGTLKHGAANVASTDRRFTIGNANGLTATIDSSAVLDTNTTSFTGTGALAYGGSGARTLTLTGSNTGTNTFAPVIGDGTGGATSLVKDGTGTWVVSGTSNTYTGNTTVVDGTLSVAAPNFADASTVTIGTSASSPAFLNLPNAGTDNVAVLIIDGVSKAAGLYDKDNSDGAITGDGKINVVAISDYDTWKTANSVTGGPNDDDDGDGVKNFDEYAFGLNPKSGASANPISSPLNKATGLFKYTRRKQSLTGLAYTYESSTTLAGAWPSFTPDSTTSNSGDPVEEITVDVPNALLANPALFIRVKAVQP